MKPLTASRATSIRRRVAGFSMIEVLVALLILLIGLLGVVRMQLLSVQNNQGAYLRTQATYIASDMLDRMRANRAGRNEGAGGGAFIDRYDGFEFSALENTRNDVIADMSCASAANGCDPEQLAAIDLMEIASNFVDVYEIGNGWVPTLPEGSISITKTASGDNDEYVVTVGWLEQDWDTDADGEAIRAGSIQRSVQLRSMIRRVELFGGAGGGGAGGGGEDGEGAGEEAGSP